MWCTKVQRKLVPYLDKELGERLNTLVLNHLNQCMRCQEELRKLSLINSALGHQEELKVPFGFSRRVLDRLTEEAVKKPIWQGFPWYLPIPTFAQVAITGMVVLLGIHLGVTFPWADKGSKNRAGFQLAEFDELVDRSVEGEYFAFCLALSQDKEG
jgi:hypothetical protein